MLGSRRWVQHAIMPHQHAYNAAYNRYITYIMSFRMPDGGYSIVSLRTR